MKKQKTPVVILYVAIVILLSAICIRIFLVDSFVVIGNSMAPTLVSGDYVFVNKLAYWHASPERGDIVVGNFRGLDDIKVIKRIVGLPREWIRTDEKDVAIRQNSREATYVPLEEPYRMPVPDSMGDTSTEPEIPTEYRLDPYEYYLLGDNRLGSVDSREVGPVDIYKIDGEVFLSFRIRDLRIMWLK